METTLLTRVAGYGVTVIAGPIASGKSTLIKSLDKSQGRRVCVVHPDQLMDICVNRDNAFFREDMGMYDGCILHVLISVGDDSQRLVTTLRNQLTALMDLQQQGKPVYTPVKFKRSSIIDIPHIILVTYPECCAEPADIVMAHRE